MPDEQVPRDVYLGERIDALGEKISDSTGNINRRLDELPDHIGEVMKRFVAPLIPRPPKVWERPPWSWMVMGAYVWFVIVSTGAVMTWGLLPPELLNSLSGAVNAYFSAAPSAGDLLNLTPASASTP